jgi:hypothetical protein
VADETWRKWRAAAEARGVSVSELVRAAVTAHLSDQPEPAPAALETPKVEATAGAVPSRACGHFKPRPGNALRCFNCGERMSDHR